MVLIGECPNCGERGSGVLELPSKQFTFCDKSECSNKYNNSIIKHMVEFNEFSSYHYYGNITSINIPRSKGGFSVGNIKKKELWNDFQCFKNEEPLIKVNFTHKERYYEKILSYDTFAKHNLHLPMINIQWSRLNLLNNETLALFNNKKQQIYDYCVVTNQATRLIILSNIYHTQPGKDINDINGLFGYIPIELIKKIIHYYFNQDDYIKCYS